MKKGENGKREKRGERKYWRDKYANRKTEE